MIVKDAKKGTWCLLTQDGSHVLGEHPTYESALKQERALRKATARPNPETMGSSEIKTLSDTIYEIAQSDSFNQWVEDSKANTKYGHCAAAVDALQVLAWVLFRNRLDVYRIAPQGELAPNSHYFAKDHDTGVIYDPTSFQFDFDIRPYYKAGEPSGFNARRKKGLYTIYDYTVSNAAREIIRRVLDQMDYTEQSPTEAIPLRTRSNPDDDSYHIQHRAPDGDSAPLWDVTRNDVYPEDFYGPMGLRYYATYHECDAEAYSIIKIAHGRRDRMVTIYRAAPRDVKGINVGDWVTICRKYARDHAYDLEGPGVNGKIIKKTVNARDLFTDGNSMLEWGYYPQPHTPRNEREAWEGWAGKKVEPHKKGK